MVANHVEPGKLCKSYLTVYELARGQLYALHAPVRKSTGTGDLIESVKSIRRVTTATMTIWQAEWDCETVGSGRATER